VAPGIVCAGTRRENENRAAGAAVDSVAIRRALARLTCVKTAGRPAHANDGERHLNTGTFH